MKLIESSVQIIEEKDPYKMIELAGRTCYKSEDKITENSAKEDVSELKLLYPEVDNLSDPANCFLQSIKNAEYYYFMLINRGWKPQQARQVLPNATKTELVMTGFESDWEHFFELRCSGAAHPDAKKLADELKSLMNVKNIELNSVK